MIYLEPNYGLANRLRTMASGLELAQASQKDIKLVWLNNPELNCPFENLFEPLPGVSFMDKSYKLNFLKTSNQQKWLPKILANVINGIIGFNYCIKEINGDLLKKESQWDVFKLTQQYKTIYIQTCGDFLSNDEFLKYFKPVAALQQLIDERTKEFTSNTIGLHIRRTDHVDAIANSPLSLFVKRMEEELLYEIDTKFYLSTDDPETEEYLKDYFGNNVLSYPKDYSRNSEQGIKDAVVDLFCLSRTKRILGSFNSSFSDIASRINDIDLQIISC